MNTALEYSTRVAQEGGRRCKKSTLNSGAPILWILRYTGVGRVKIILVL
jgi:hypothetical protein